ncbi:Glycosyltransferase, GT2 family [Lutimaribacter pacificus]|uniref:Glycosyltransferase, GT2 family n=1 Tax=Lutimaribacter pacificus TaxID=391948 RepID=A0A1H0CR15_9RHOB|nr:glycosyltransferase [Lutimaribacter pacificus]SDN60339.1 Glycosyltransferase, GT2 family [Lutimaribacter pacificus]SHJ41667.1 Glycosyltransferase, GT2 family [Lutimaribacter pacificus]
MLRRIQALFARYAARHARPGPAGGLARTGLLLRFLRDGAGALPAVLRWFRHRDPAARAEVKARLGLGPPDAVLRVDPGFLDGGGAGVRADTAITIVMPVHNAFAMVQEALARVARHTELPWRLVLVEDGSTDPRVRPWLRDWAAAQGARVRLLENARNLGFVGSVNRALGVARGYGDPVVLLNSDAMVPAGWAARLVAPMLADTGVASVTPMSNDAELLSVPVPCRATALRAGEGDAIDAVARRFDPGAQIVAAPTGVGFCMALSPRFLALVPGFDPAFGRGYGEEVDWCQKVQALGGRHLCLPGLFVEHRGGASFGAEKQALLRASGAILSARYPGFDASVDGFLRADPLRGPRLALALGWAAARVRGRVPVYLGHAMGGGAERDLERRVARDVAGKGAAVVLRVGGALRWQIELHSDAGVTAGGCDSADGVRAFLALLPARRVVYSCAVGAADPLEVPALLNALAGGAAHRLEVLVHDYLPVSPSYTLLGADGIYDGVPQPGDEGRAHRFRQRDGRVVGLAEWRACWGAMIAAADRVELFSEASRAIMAGAFPDAAGRMRVNPHRPLAQIPRIDARAGPRPVIGVLGHIGLHKGAGVLAGMARRRRARLVVIGDLDPAHALRSPAHVHGAYTHDELPGLVARYGITCWLIPSVWPETFSFATHEAVATGLPVFCFELGAQAEAVRRAGRGAVVPLRRGGDPAGDMLDAILRHEARQ